MTPKGCLVEGWTVPDLSKTTLGARCMWGWHPVCVCGEGRSLIQLLGFLLDLQQLEHESLSENVTFAILSNFTYY